MEHDTDDVIGDVAWMTYAEIGRARGISTLSAKRLAQRRRWRRQQGNDGTSRVAVPMTDATPRETKSGDIIGDVTGDVARITSAFEGALGTLREQLGRAEARADAADTHIQALRSEIERLRAAHERAVQAADQLQRAEAARRAQDVWARIWQALRGR